MNNRNRSEGWTHAKISGHKNEEYAANYIMSCSDIQLSLANMSNLNNLLFNAVEFGGLHEKKVESVFNGKKTTSKTDIVIPCVNSSSLNISLKKDAGGQVFLISVHRFITGFEIQYNKIIPNDVREALELFFGSKHFSQIETIINNYKGNNYEYEYKKKRLTAHTLYQYSPILYDSLIQWFANNIQDVFDFCFIRGLAKHSYDWAHIIWYKNFFYENSYNYLFNLKQIKYKLSSNIEYGQKNGGTTIQLPFGFLQWHNPSKKEYGDMQFHHSLDKLIGL